MGWKPPLLATDNGAMCVESSAGSGSLSFLGCCVAKVSGVEYWNDTCLAFGRVGSNCSSALEQILSAILETPRSISWQAAKPAGTNLQLTGEVLVDCDHDGCNHVTKDTVLDPRTRLPTDKPLCPIAESSKRGISCFEGPWEVTRVANPYSECQGGQNRYNFCLNRKTFNGRPFARCCSFVYLNPFGIGECLFIGLPEGSCERYIQFLQANLSSNRYTRISQPFVLN